MQQKSIIHILLIEDDEDDSFIFKEIIAEIQKQKYRITWIENYNKALKEVHKEEYDIIFIDYNLGQYTGLDVINKVQELNPNIPVIMLTGQNDRELDMVAMEKGVADFLIKGKIDSELLERSIRYAIEKKKTEREILYLAYYDQVTDLPNRIFFKEQLNFALAHAIRYNRILAVFFLDLDNFKLINDSLGHHIGDMLLKQVAERLCLSVRRGDIIARNNLKTLIDTIARLGGDEFTISLTEITDYENASVVAKRIIQSLKKPFLIEGHEIFTSASIGISLYPADSDNGDTLLKYADNAMYYAKKMGKNNFQYYRKSMNDKVMNKIQLNTNLRKALENKEFLLNYQPKMSIASGSIIGYEALIRWKSPQVGMVPPNEFIPFAEEHHLISSITDWVMEEVCHSLQSWQKNCLNPPPVSINIPITCFNRPDFVKRIIETILAHGLSPRLIELEVTESIFMKDMQDINSKLRRLQAEGIQISIDDFGTGFSSLNRLKGIPCNTLKIDKSFVDNIGGEAADNIIIGSIILMGHGLNMQILAEGVETETQFQFLKAKQCNIIQGYLLSPPLPVDKIPELLTDELNGKGAGKQLLEKLEGLR